VYGDGACLSVDSEEGDDMPDVTILEVISDCKYPVATINKDAVRVAEGPVHVHNFSSRKIAGDCTHADTYVLECADCGYQITDHSYHETTFGNCDPEKLIFHEAIEPDMCQFGNVAYYECLECGKKYSDSRCANDISDEVALLPTNIDEMISMPRGALLSAGWIKDLIIGVLTTVPGMITTEYQTWTTPVKEFREFSKRLNDLSGELHKIENQINQIATAVNNVPYIIKVRNRINQLKDIYALNEKTDLALSIVFNDKTKTQRQMDSLKALHIQQWSGIYEGSTATLHPHEIVLGLMSDYSMELIGPNMPQMYGEVISSYFIWEHLGYYLRTLMLLYDAVVVSDAYYYAQNYARVNKAYASDVMRENYQKMLETMYVVYKTAVESELNRMEQRELKYRRYMPTNTTYDRNVYRSFDFYSFFMTDKPLYLPRSNARVSIQNCNEMMEYKCSRRLVGSSFMDALVASQTYANYKTMVSQDKLPEGYPKNLDAIQVLDSIGFTGISKINNFRLIMNSSQKFQYSGGDIALPLYWNIRWRSYKASLFHDWIDVGPILKTDGSICDDKVANNCNIDTGNGFVGHLRCQVEKSDLKSRNFGAIIVYKQDQFPSPVTK